MAGQGEWRKAEEGDAYIKTKRCTRDQPTNFILYLSLSYTRGPKTNSTTYAKQT